MAETNADKLKRVAAGLRLRAKSLMPDRLRCAHCGRRTPAHNYSTVTTCGGEVFAYHDKAPCRRAQHERHGRPLPIQGASTEALGAALIAADYVRWPWWARLVGARRRDALRSEFARRLAAAVESHAERRAVEAVDVDG
jgi:hypothetical protein